MSRPAGKLVLLAVSPRVAPGLLSWDAWELLRRADVVTAVADHPQLPALRAAGVEVSATGAAAAVEELAGQLVAKAAGGRTVVWLCAADGAPALAAAVAGQLQSAACGEPGCEVEQLSGSFDLPGARFVELVAVMARLRSPGGCPWDREQDHRSLATYLVEEAYEALDAIENGDAQHLAEELGDLLAQVVFHARIGEEHAVAPWSADDVAAGIIEKLVRRHPHVFAPIPRDATPSAAQVEASWEQIKVAEKGRSSAVDGIPPTLPALSLAAKLLSRAEHAGVPVSVPPLDPDSEIGELLLAAVALARSSGVDAEQALRESTRRYAAAIRAAEARAPG